MSRPGSNAPSELASPYVRLCNDLAMLIDDYEAPAAKGVPVVTLPASTSSVSVGLGAPAAQRNAALAGLYVGDRMGVQERLCVGERQGGPERLYVGDACDDWGGDECPQQARSVWVGNVGPGVTAEALAASFGAFGAVESVRVLDAKGCAFVNFAVSSDAEAARRGMMGASVAGSTLKTGFARSAAAPVFRCEDVFGLAAGRVASPAECPLSPLICAADVDPGAFCAPIPPIPAEATRLPPSLAGSAMRDARRRLEQYGGVMGPDELDAHALEVCGAAVAVCVDAVGNILAQRVLERCGPRVPDAMLAALAPWLAAVGVHKHGTWAVQRLIKHCALANQRAEVAAALAPHAVPLLQDQFGNYVVQCVLPFGAAHNQFVLDALYHRCADVAASRFGARAMRSVLESPHVSRRQRDFVAMAVLAHAPRLARDPNGVLVVQWLLDAPLPGRHACVARVLSGSVVALAASKTGSAVVARLLGPAIEDDARDLVLGELLAPASLPALLADGLASSIVLKAVSLGSLTDAERLRHAHAILGVLNMRRAVLPADAPQSLLRVRCEALLSAVDIQPAGRVAAASAMRVPVARHPSAAVGAPVRRVQ